MQLALDKAAGGDFYAGVLLREVGSGFYKVRARFRPDGSVALQLVGGSSTSTVTIPGLSYVPGTTLQLRASATGASPTTIRARIWAAGATEPSTWPLQVTDSSAALQTSGALGLDGYLSSSATNAPVTLRYDNYLATDVGAPPPANLPPVASFTSSASELAASFDGTASSDPDGTITSWAWGYGDGATGTGSTSSHSYAAAGTYTVTLTVTDNSGATGQTSSTVTTTPPATGPLVMAAIGDMPYGSSQLTMLPGRIDQLNADPQVNVAAHVGDISSPIDCSTSYFETIKSQFDRFADPLVYTPGDNEWADCSGAAIGAGNPLERLSVLRSIFYPTPGMTLGVARVPVTAQSGYPENVLFNSGGITVGALHLVGSFNDLAVWSGYKKRTVEQQAEFDARQIANVDHLRLTFAQAKSAGSRAVVILMQADMFHPAGPSSLPSVYKTAFQVVVQELAAQSASFGLPVLLVNGDTHSYVKDQPLTTSTWLTYYGIAAPVGNLTRVTVKGGSTASEWLKISVVDGPAVFETQQVPFD